MRALHSDQSLAVQDQIEADFRRGQIDYLVTIRKLDEGMNYPDLSLYIDLNRSVGVRPLLQRIGRVLRLNEGKESVDIAVMIDVDQQSVGEAIRLFEKIEARAFSGVQIRVDSIRRRDEARLSKFGELVANIKKFWMVAPMRPASGFVGYAEASSWAQIQKITTLAEWQIRKDQPDFPAFIPKTPDTFFKEKGWKNWPEFLGTGSTVYVSYEDAAAWAKSQGIKTSVQWRDRIKRGQWPAGVPKSPESVYRTTGWRSWIEFLGTGSRSRTTFVDYAEASSWAQSQQIRTLTEWKIKKDQPDFPAGIPITPQNAYKDKGWKNWPEYLGTGSTDYVSYNQAAAWARSEGIKTSVQWHERIGRGNWPVGIPKAPNKHYRGTGWQSWPLFLGENFFLVETASGRSV